MQVALTPARGQAIAALFAPMTAADHPGVAYTVFHGDAPLVTHVHGLADFEQQSPVTRDTIFRIGSITKQFCATALLLLERRGALSLEDPVAKHIPEMPACTADLTLRHLLTMTSGLYDGVALTIFSGRGNLAMTRQEHLGLVSRWDRLMFAPGDQVLYSNTNYAILSFVVERASGMSLADFLAKEIFQPLGMPSARLTERALEAVPGKARGYLPGRSPGSFEMGLMLYEASGDGGIDLSIADFERWYLNYRKDRVFGEGYRDRMEREVKLGNGALSEYRLGVTVSRHRHWRKVHHAGGMPGYLADIAHYPELDLGVVLLTNFMAPGVLDAGDAIVDILTDAPSTKAGEPAIAPGFFLCTERAMALQFESTADGTACYLLGDRSLLEGTRARGLRPRKAASGYQVDVVTNDEVRLSFGAGASATFRRWTEPADSQDLSELTGAFRSRMLGETHFVGLGSDGTLEVTLDSGMRQLGWNRLRRRARDFFTAVVRNEPTETNLIVHFRRDSAGHVCGLEYTTFRVRGLHFHKVTP